MNAQPIPPPERRPRGQPPSRVTQVGGIAGGHTAKSVTGPALHGKVPSQQYYVGGPLKFKAKIVGFKLSILYILSKVFSSLKPQLQKAFQKIYTSKFEILKSDYPLDQDPLPLFRLYANIVKLEAHFGSNTMSELKTQVGSEFKQRQEESMATFKSKLPKLPEAGLFEKVTAQAKKDQGNLQKANELLNEKREALASLQTSRRRAFTQDREQLVKTKNETIKSEQEKVSANWTKEKDKLLEKISILNTEIQALGKNWLRQAKGKLTKHIGKKEEQKRAEVKELSARLEQRKEEVNAQLAQIRTDEEANYTASLTRLDQEESAIPKEMLGLEKEIEQLSLQFTEAQEKASKSQALLTELNQIKKSAQQTEGRDDLLRLMVFQEVFVAFQQADDHSDPSGFFSERVVDSTILQKVQKAFPIPVGPITIVRTVPSTRPEGIDDLL